MSPRRAVLFPGQGAQFVGMSADLIDRCPAVERMFQAASRLMGVDLWTLCTDGPEERIHATAVSQPAIFVVSLAVREAIGAAGGADRLDALATAGLSLGEYSALVFAGAMSFEGALEIVVRRGEYMQEACDRHPGGMTSLLGLRLDEVRALVEDVRSTGVIGVANVNAERQIVVSGELDALARIAELALERGASRVVPLRVAGAYHSPLMASASAELAPWLERAEIRRPRLPFYPNVTARPVDAPAEIRRGLLRQIESPVLWGPTMQAIVNGGVEEVLELGPGRVLAGLLKQVDRRLPAISLLDAESVERFLAP